MPNKNKHGMAEGQKLTRTGKNPNIAILVRHDRPGVSAHCMGYIHPEPRIDAKATQERGPRVLDSLAPGQPHRQQSYLIVLIRDGNSGIADQTGMQEFSQTSLRFRDSRSIRVQSSSPGHLPQSKSMVCQRILPCRLVELFASITSTALTWTPCCRVFVYSVYDSLARVNLASACLLVWPC